MMPCSTGDMDVLSWFWAKNTVFGPKTLILGQFVLFLDLYIQHKLENLCFLYFHNFITQCAILFITIDRKFEISSTWGFKIRLIYINFDEKLTFFLPYLVKNSYFGSNYKMKALNFMFYVILKLIKFPSKWYHLWQVIWTFGSDFGP